MSPSTSPTKKPKPTPKKKAKPKKAPPKKDWKPAREEAPVVPMEKLTGQAVVQETTADATAEWLPEEIEAGRPLYSVRVRRAMRSQRESQ